VGADPHAGEVPAFDAVAARLRAHLPAQQRTALVHGDYRLDNVVFDSAHRVEAVLDRELCTLGDPLADVGWLLATWVLPGEDASFMISGTPTRLPGFPPRDELLHRYAQRSDWTSPRSRATRPSRYGSSRASPRGSAPATPLAPAGAATRSIRG
jgi:aminoglycoside phosphotransferase (APT) family kinase protein